MTNGPGGDCARRGHATLGVCKVQLLTLRCPHATMGLWGNGPLATKVGAKQTRANFSDLLGSVHYGHETVIVEKAGKPFVVVISREQYAQYQELVRDRAIQAMDRVHKRNEGANPEQLEREIADLVEQVRQERYEQRAD